MRSPYLAPFALLAGLVVGAIAAISAATVYVLGHTGRAA